MSLKKTVLDGLMMIGIACLVLAAGEIGLRFIYPEKVKGSQPPLKDPAYEFNETYLVSLKSNIAKTFVRASENGGDVIRWQTNRDGFRGPELRENPQGRIIVYGDSNVQARFSLLEYTFPYRLEKELNSLSQQDIEVINAGVVGFGPDQSFLRFKQEAGVYHPNLVIFHIFAHNDFGDLIRNRLFEFDGSGQFVETDLARTVDQKLSEERPAQSVQGMLSSLLLAQAAKKIVRMIKKESKHDSLFKSNMSLIDQEYAVYKNSRPREFSHFADSYDYDVALFPERESTKTKIALMEGVLQQAKVFADSGEIDFMVLIQPSPQDLTSNQTLNFQYFSQYPGYRQSNLTTAVGKICQRHQLHYVDLFAVFSEKGPEHLFFKGSAEHWNDAGQSLAARVTAEYIAENMW